MLILNLRTRDPARARFLAGQVTALADTFVIEARTMGLTPQQTQQIFAQTFTAHLNRLERIAVRERAEPRYDPERERSADHRMGWVYRLLETRGHDAQVDERAASQMWSAGLDEDSIAEVAAMLDDLRRHRLVPERRERLQTIVEAQGGEPSPMALMMAEHQIYRARAAACFELARRHDGIRVEDEALIARILRDQVEQSSTPVRAPAQPTPEAAIMPDQAPSWIEVTPPAKDVSSQKTSLAEVIPAHHFVIQIGERLIVSKTRGDVQDRAWDTKTARQAQQCFRLFARMLCEQQILNIEQLRQRHFATLVELFHGLAKSYGKSPKDEERSCTELLNVGKMKDDSERGLAPETINRHLSFLNTWIEFAESQGIEIDNKINISRLRPKVRGRARSKRGFFNTDHLNAVFALPCFTGCAGWENKVVYLAPGPHVYHRALYFVPLLLFYTLARREEICGLLIDDVSVVKTLKGDEAYIAIRWNDQRRVKSDSSNRIIPLHPELLRLGFIEYVEAVRHLGYKLVFPDLQSPTSKSPLGDRFYDEFTPVIRQAVPDAGNRRQVIHSIRRTGGNELKKREVDSERRGDILGHKGETIAEEIYSDDTPLAQKRATLMQLPVVTSVIQPRPITLLPWVLRREVPPYSRPSRLRAKSC